MKASFSGRRSLPVIAIAAIYFAAHLPSLAPSLEDIDSINFALGLRMFSPALHQPHPPGYPVYMALAHVSLAVVERLSALDRTAAEAWALAIWSAIGGAACIVAAWFVFVAIQDRHRAVGNGQRATGSRHAVGSGERTAIWATTLLAASPLFWMTGLRPMSDIPGLALAMTAQALILRAANPTRCLQGAFLAGIAAGIRVQTAALTCPLLALVLFEQWNTSESASSSARIGSRLAAAMQPLVLFVIGCLVWGIPLIVASGGAQAYVAALNTQAGEDFAWVDMLASNPTPRHIAVALYQTLVLPWASTPLAVVVAVAAAAGFLVMAWGERRALATLLIAFTPYMVFHLLFQETATIRYGLPVLPLVAWLAARGVALAARRTSFIAAPIVAGSLIVAVPGGVAYGREPHPAFRAIADAVQRARVQRPAAVYSHYAVRRPLQAAGVGSLPVVEPRVRYEWLDLVDYWRRGETAPVWFFADQRRTDLALIDPRSRGDVIRYRWSVENRSELGGTRPLGVDWYRLQVPGWFAGEGWSLTPETGGVTEASSSGPDHRPIEAWVQRRPGAFHVMVGGRHLGGAADADAEIELAIDGRQVDRWTLRAADRTFLKFVDLPEGIAGPGLFAKVAISAHSLDPRRAAPVAIRQFDIQPAGQLVYGFGEGWHEDEYVVDTGLSWRWTSERSLLRIDGAHQPVRITLRGESPLRYVDAPPTVKIVAGGSTIAQFRPSADFEWTIIVPEAALERSHGEVAIETDRVYIPDSVEGNGDMRHLGLRIFECRVMTASL